ncbi:MAG: malate synthase [Clostridiales bacterium]|nr:malate synthase [Clostridiales bacterium]
MDLVNKKVIHDRFGEGNVVNYDDSYVNINFKSGTKKFVFPDAFGQYVKLIDKRMATLIGKKVQKRQEEREKEELELEAERALEQRRRYILRHEKRMRARKIHPKLQSVFWCEAREVEEVFTEWKIFIGRSKTGQKKGQPRKLPRMSPNSACLLTKREPDMKEKNRQILGMFMADATFNGRQREDGYIPSHPKYRLRLSAEESEKMLFWNYYINKGFPNNMTWNSGRQRYFDNIWMAQILRDIISLRADSEGLEDAQNFFEYFCRINRIDPETLPEPKGALKRN